MEWKLQAFFKYLWTTKQTYHIGLSGKVVRCCSCLTAVQWLWLITGMRLLQKYSLDKFLQLFLFAVCSTQTTLILDQHQISKYNVKIDFLVAHSWYSGETFLFLLFTYKSLHIKDENSYKFCWNFVEILLKF